jgi:hypothetical protein
MFFAVCLVPIVEGVYDFNRDVCGIRVGLVRVDVVESGGKYERFDQ